MLIVAFICFFALVVAWLFAANVEGAEVAAAPAPAGRPATTANIA